MEKTQALDNLRNFVLLLVLNGVRSKADYRLWQKEREGTMEKLFDYNREQEMPSIGDLVSPFFHPNLPLIGLGYSHLAHNVLYKYPQGWTEPLRLCRGLVFDRNGNLVALPFPKFFNAGEHPETKILPNRPVEVMEKMDGHLGIIFWYEGEFHLTTRGSFISKTAGFAGKMLTKAVNDHDWEGADVKHLTILVEIIHPETHVICDYANDSKFVLIGAYDLRNLVDLSYEELISLSCRLGIQIAKRWSFLTSRDVMKAILDPHVKNREGFVVRYADGRRIKFKFKTYLKEMIGEKLSYPYLMLRYMDGRITGVMKNLPEEVLPEAELMLENLKKARRMRRPVKERWQYLYGLLPPEQSTSYYRSICRDFIRHRKS